MMAVNDKLIDRFLDGDISKDEAAVVSQWLEVPANLERFAKRAELHADLRSALRRRSIQSTALEADSENRLAAALTVANEPDRSGWRISRTTFGFGVIAFVTAACLLIAFGLRTPQSRPASSHGHLASVVSEIDAVLISDQSNWRETGLAAGQCHLEKGLLHLRFDGGVMVYVEAPTQFEAVSGKRLVLHRGRLSASVPPEGVGFTVETPEAEVVDFGTEFSLDVEFGTSEVHVFDGLVRVQLRSKMGGQSGDVVDLRTSQAVKIEDSAQRPVDIEIARDRFIRNFDEPKRKYARSVRTAGFKRPSETLTVNCRP